MFFLKKLIILFSKDVIEVMAKKFIMLDNCVLNKCCSFELSIHHCFHKNIKQASVFSIDDNNNKHLLSTKLAY